MTNFIHDITIHVFVDKSIYSADVINKCLYWYGDKFRTSFHSYDDRFYEITLQPNSSEIGKDQLEVHMIKFERDLIDFRLRDVINKETQSVRELLIAKAFSRFETDDNCSEDFRDPVQKKIEETTHK